MILNSFSTGKIYKSRKSVVAHERLTEPRVTMELLLAKLRSFSNLPAFLDLNEIIIWLNSKTQIKRYLKKMTKLGSQWKRTFNFLYGKNLWIS